jgi:hypothetical protein
MWEDFMRGNWPAAAIASMAEELAGPAATADVMAPHTRQPAAVGTLAFADSVTSPAMAVADAPPPARGHRERRLRHRGGLGRQLIAAVGLTS